METFELPDATLLLHRKLNSKDAHFFGNTHQTLGPKEGIGARQLHGYAELIMTFELIIPNKLFESANLTRQRR